MQSRVLLFLDDPLETIQLQKVQQNLKRPTDTQRKGSYENLMETRCPSLIQERPAHHYSLPLRLPFVHNTALKKGV